MLVEEEILAFLKESIQALVVKVNTLEKRSARQEKLAIVLICALVVLGGDRAIIIANGLLQASIVP